MRYTWIDEYLMNKRAVTKDLQEDWNWIRYQIGGKMFAAICLDENNRPYYINLKLEPMEGEYLREQFPDIIPGYYCNKVHWNSIKPDGEVPDELVKDLLDKSYHLVLEGFSKKKQQEILESAGSKKSFDYKKEYKEFYLPPKTPGIVDIPEMNYIAVRGHGDPNVPEGQYQEALSLLYGIAFTIKMSYKGSHKIDGYFSYVVPPLEGLWWQGNQEIIDYAHKENFEWIAMIRLPAFVTEEEFKWAVGEATVKKNSDFSKVEFFTYHEGLCVQSMHIGSYDNEPVTIEKMNRFLSENGYSNDFSDIRFHHEIYLSDPRRTAPDKLKTVIRHPIRKNNEL